jgi:hypothetical protein
MFFNQSNLTTPPVNNGDLTPTRKISNLRELLGFDPSMLPSIKKLKPETITTSDGEELEYDPSILPSIKKPGSVRITYPDGQVLEYDPSILPSIKKNLIKITYPNGEVEEIDPSFLPSITKLALEEEYRNLPDGTESSIDRIVEYVGHSNSSSPQKEDPSNVQAASIISSMNDLFKTARNGNPPSTAPADLIALPNMLRK